MAVKNYRWTKIVKFVIDGGSDWGDIHCSHDGKILEFDVTKMTNEFGHDSATIYGVLENPVKIRVEVTYVASPLNTTRKEIVGVIKEMPDQVVVRSDVKDETGLLYLKEGDTVRIRYNIDTKVGYITFTEKEWLRMCVQDGTLNFLTTNDCLGRAGRMMEIVQYADLKQSDVDISQIQTVQDIAQYAEINEMDPNIYKVKKYDIVQDTLLAVNEQSIISC